MTLHEAIEYVLRNHHISKTSREIADKIYTTNLCERGDRSQVPASQISARRSHHPEILKRVGGKSV